MSTDSTAQSTQETTQNTATSQGGEAAPTFTVEHFNAMQEQLRAANEKIGSLAKSAETVNKIQKVFAPEAEPQADPDEQFLDTYLQAAVDAEKAGSPIPLTTNLAVKLIEQAKRNQELEKRLAQIEGKARDYEDPVRVADQRAFESIDSMLVQTLGNMYGEGNYAPQLVTSTANMIVEEIKRLKSQTPEIWDQIKRNPQYQAKMVQHFAQKNIPDRFKQAAQREELQNYKMQAPELMQAFREANEIQDPSARAKVKEQIRQQLFSSLWEQKKGNSFISKMYR